MGRRIDNYPITTTITGGDYVLIDSQALGTRRILASDIGGGGDTPIEGVTIDVIGVPYDGNTVYNVGDSATYNDKLWTPVRTTSIGTFNPSDWQEISTVVYLLDKDNEIWASIGFIQSDIYTLKVEAASIFLDICPEFNSETLYSKGDLVIHSYLLYRCTSESPVSGAWDTIYSNFTETNIVEELNSLKADISTINTNISNLSDRVDITETDISNLEELVPIYAPEYDPNSTYNEGDYASHSNKLYVCGANNVTGSWNLAYWSKTDIPTELIRIKSTSSGSNTYSGTSVPLASLGSDNDTYMQYDSNGINAVYGKINGGWVLYPTGGGGGDMNIIHPLSITERDITTNTFSVE